MVCLFFWDLFKNAEFRLKVALVRINAFILELFLSWQNSNLQKERFLICVLIQYFWKNSRAFEGKKIQKYC